MYKLRDYQQKASDAAVSFFANKAKKNNAIMVLPTGAGKSLVIADIAARLNGHTLVFVWRTRLLYLFSIVRAKGDFKNNLCHHRQRD